MADVFEVTRDTNRDFALSIVDPDTGTPFLLDGTYTLSAKVWLGDEIQVLFAPTVQLDGTPPTANILLRFARSQVSSLTPADYSLQIWADKGSDHRELWTDGPAVLRILPSPGSATARSAWITYDQLLGYNPAVDLHLDTNRNQSGFLQQRADATDELKKRILDRAKLRPGFTRRRGSTYDPIHGYEPQDFATSPPTKAQIAAAMEANRLRVDIVAREVLARMTLDLILGPEITADSRSNPFPAFVIASNARADQLFESWRASIDLDGDAVDDVLIGVDATWLGDLP